MKEKIKKTVSWTAQITASIILLQTLYFKFSGSEESVYIFSTLGVEPWGRLGAGAVELIAAVMLLIPRLAWMGAFISISAITVAVISHLTVLGIEIMGDGGLLFSLAITVFISSLTVLVLRKKTLSELLGDL